MTLCTQPTKMCSDCLKPLQRFQVRYGYFRIPVSYFNSEPQTWRKYHEPSTGHEGSSVIHFSSDSLRLFFLMSNLRCSSNQSCKMRWRVRWRNIAARSWATLEEAVDNILHGMKRILMRFMRLCPSGFVWTLSIPKFVRFSGYHHFPHKLPILGIRYTILLFWDIDKCAIRLEALKVHLWEVHPAAWPWTGAGVAKFRSSIWLSTLSFQGCFLLWQRIHLRQLRRSLTYNCMQLCWKEYLATAQAFLTGNQIAYDSMVHHGRVWSIMVHHLSRPTTSLTFLRLFCWTVVSVCFCSLNEEDFCVDPRTTGFTASSCRLIRRSLWKFLGPSTQWLVLNVSKHLQPDTFYMFLQYF